MKDGYMGQFLYLDLDTQISRKLSLPQWLKDDYVGGKGFGAKLLYDLTERNVDPLGPDNPLMFLTGPLCSTTAPAVRACVVCKSPATHTFLDSYFGGRFGAEIKYAGYDGLIIRGKAARPTYLWIQDDRIEFRPADQLWGTDSLKANELIKNELNAQDAMVATIGQAGENQVLFSLITCEYNRQAGRGGAGAVMGSKNLKGIAIKGTRFVAVNDRSALSQALEKANREILAGEDCTALTDVGTSYAVPWSSAVGLLPYKNHALQHDPNVAKIDDNAQRKHIFLGKSACLGCPIRCSQMGAVRTGKHAPFVTDIVEYESVAMLGSNIAVSSIRDVAYLTKLCDTYGLDSISTGNVVGFAFEAAQKGLIEQPEAGLLEFGNAEGAEYLIKSIALQENELGKLLGQGVKRAAMELGQNASEYALHVKGLEIPGWAVRGAPGMGLAYATADRGACHQRGFMIGYEFGGIPYQGGAVEPYAIERKAEILIHEQNYLAGLDALVKCDFGAFGVSADCYAELLNSVAGRRIKADYFNELGERIWNLTRLFNLREGLTEDDDTLPKRITEAFLAGGPHQGHRISRDDLKAMLADYYRIRNWDSSGRPTDENLDRLGLKNTERFTCDEQLAKDC
ncbi:MAG: aldehyde ferredoxin oxidoreductase family protein [Proteobacteria bacterium]|nr:aldehyde ferredoxin oxidoreductase family protein [Pseudomonadota bacterium]